jgi:hypothetical protein
VWWCTPALGRLKQEDSNFWTSLGYKARPYLRKQQQQQKNKKQKSEVVRADDQD